MASHPTVVRLFSDHAGSPLWLQDFGNVDPERLELSEDLCFRLRSWAEYFAHNLDFRGGHELEWAPDADETAYERDGRAMAGELSRQLGHDFEGYYSSMDDKLRRPMTFRVRHEALTPAAAAAAFNLLDQERW